MPRQKRVCVLQGLVHFSRRVFASVGPGCSVVSSVSYTTVSCAVSAVQKASCDVWVAAGCSPGSVGITLQHFVPSSDVNDRAQTLTTSLLYLRHHLLYPKWFQFLWVVEKPEQPEASRPTRLLWLVF